MDKPFFSIVIPIYKVEKYLKECIDSILAQDFENYEVILVDDGSPDKCPDICDEYAANNPLIHVIHKPNGGLSDARNAGMGLARAEYITFVDSDDFWKDKDVLTGILRVIKANGYPDIVTSDIIKYDDAEEKSLYPSVISEEYLNGVSKIEMLRHFYYNQGDMKMSACQKFVKRELASNILFTKGLLSEDIDWSIKLYSEASSICVYEKPYYCYRQNREGSITNTAAQRSFDSLIHIIDKWSMLIPKMEVDEEEKSIYFGYLAYQLSIAILLLSNANSDKRNENKSVLSKHLTLFSYPTNFKTKKVKMLTKLVGISTASKVLKAYNKLR